MERIVTKIKDSLEEQIGLYLRMPVYLDRDRLTPGLRYTHSLANAICDSVCMVLLYTPLYDDSDWCQKELATMQEVERKRFELVGIPPAGQSLIIPIVLAGASCLPTMFREHVHFYDFTSATLSQRILKTMQSTKKINKIAEYIKCCHDHLLPIGSQLDTYYAGLRLPAALAPMRGPKKSSDYYLPLHSPPPEATLDLR